MPAVSVALACGSVVGLIAGPPVSAQSTDSLVQISIVYTGRSLGAMGVLRAQEEHELLTEQATADGVPFRLVSHMCWRRPGLAVFQPSEEPTGDELPEILASRDTMERIDSVPALRSNNVLIVQDPWREGPDLLAMIERNPRRRSGFPDLVPTTVRVYRMRTARGDRAMVVEELGAVWEDDPATWHTGEINRVDIGDTRIFEFPVNLGEIGPRASVLGDILAASQRQSAATLIADLGERGADLGMTDADRARLDYGTLTRLSYALSVPYEFELSLGLEGLGAVRRQFSQLAFLAANVHAADSTLFVAHQIYQIGGVTLGLFGLVSPAIRADLPRETLDDFVFEPYLDAARREVQVLQDSGVHAIIALTNLDPPDNALLAQAVAGIDAIVADLHVRSSPEMVRTSIALPDRPRVRPGSPALVARGVANGVGIGRLDLVFRRPSRTAPFSLTSMSHEVVPVTDRTPADPAFLAQIQRLANVVKPARGELMFPSFVELTDRHPALRDYDETTVHGRVSKRMWEEFLARLLRLRGQAEIAIIRTLPHFPPLIGKLHENEIGSWLWTKDGIVLLDLTGADIKKVLLEDSRGELTVSGIDRTRWIVMGRRLDDNVYYRVATTDILYQGARFRAFENARRVRRNLRAADNGTIAAVRHGAPLSLQDFAFGELRRLRASARGDEYVDLIASLVAPDPPYASLVTLSFDQPTLWVSFNQNHNNGAYGSVPESRVASLDSWLVGLNGRFAIAREGRAFATELGFGVAYARQRSTLEMGGNQINESADDLKTDLTIRPRGGAGARMRPFLRGVFDTEFTPTTDRVTGAQNPHQLALRGVAGLMLPPQRFWRRVEVAAAVENDFGQPNLQYGMQARAELFRPMGPGGRLVYRWRNDATYFFPSPRDTESQLALRYNMVHELLVPLVDELALSVAGDFFFYRGKTEVTRDPGVSLLLRVGLTYNRLWKPRYQPFF